MPQRGTTYPQKHFGTLVESAIEGRFASQSAAAASLGVDRTTFNKWIRGKGHPGKGTNINSLASRLRMPVDKVRMAILMDKIDAARVDADRSEVELLRAAVNIAINAGLTRKELARLLEEPVN